MTQTIAECFQVHKSFTDGEQSHQVLNNINFTLKPRDTIALTGSSGSGKSTLLNLIAGFDVQNKGTIYLNGENTQYWRDREWSLFRRTHLKVIFQQFNLLSALNVKDNIQFPLALLNQSWSPWCDYLLEKLEIKDLKHRHIEKLSGGQQQRVAIARALAHKPLLLLADEPTGSLDGQAGLKVMELLCELAQEANSCVLLVTHAQECAQFMNRQWRLEQGVLQQKTVQQSSLVVENDE